LEIINFLNWITIAVRCQCQRSARDMKKEMGAASRKLPKNGYKPRYVLWRKKKNRNGLEKK